MAAVTRGFGVGLQKGKKEEKQRRRGDVASTKSIPFRQMGEKKAQKTAEKRQRKRTADGEKLNAACTWLQMSGEGYVHISADWYMQYIANDVQQRGYIAEGINYCPDFSNNIVAKWIAAERRLPLFCLTLIAKFLGKIFGNLQEFTRKMSLLFDQYLKMCFSSRILKFKRNIFGNQELF